MPNRVASAPLTVTPPVTDNPSRQRFELSVQGAEAFIDYLRDGNILTLTYAQVPGHLRGSGVGTMLVKGALQIVRQRHQTVVPQCSFVAAYMARHPETHDLLAAHCQKR